VVHWGPRRAVLADSDAQSSAPEAARAGSSFADPAVARRHLRWLAAAVFVVNFFLLGPVLTLFPTLEGVYQRTRFFTYDLVHQVRAQLTVRGLLSRAPPEEVLIVGVDEEALVEYGRWPWPRRLQARLLTTLKRAGAASIAVDILLKEPDRGPVHELREELEAREDLPARLARLREALAAIDQGGASGDEAVAPDQAWLLDPEGGDGELARTLAGSGNIVLGNFLEYSRSRNAAVNWLTPPKGAAPPAEALELLLRRDPELDAERLARDWRKGFFPVRFFEQYKAFPLAEVGGVAGLALEEQTQGGAAPLALTNLSVTAPDGSAVQGLYLPRGIFLEGAAASGFLNDDTTLDGTVRSFPMVPSSSGSPPTSSRSS
jgi:hypothetical protein